MCSVAVTVVLIMMATDDADARAVWGTLKFLAMRADGLKNGDGPYEDSEAYVSFYAYREGDQPVRKHTSTAKSDNDVNSAIWFEEVDFGYAGWESMKVQVWDEDTSWWRDGDDKMSNAVVLHFTTYWKCRDEDQSAHLGPGDATLTFRYCIE